MANTTGLIAHRTIRMGLYQAGLACAAFNALMVWPILGGQISANTLGSFTTAIALVAVIAPGFSFGLNVFALRHATGTEMVLRLEAGSAVRFLGSLYFVGSLLLLPMGLLFRSTSLMVATSALSGAAIINAIALIRAQDRMFGFAVATVVSQSATLVVPLWLMAQGWSLLAALSMFTVINLAIAIILTWSQGSFVGWWSGRAAFRSALRMGLPVIPHLVLSVAIVNGVRAVVGLVVGYEAGATFLYASVAAGLGLTVVISFAGHETTEILREHSRVTLTKRVESSGRNLAILSTVMVIIIVLLSGAPLSQWLPESIDSTSVRAAILMTLPAVPLHAAGDLVAVRHLFSGRTWALSVATFLGCLAMIVAVVWFGGGLGAAAGGLAVSLGTGVRVLATALLLPERARVPEIRWLLLCSFLTTVLSLLLLLK